MFFVSEKPDVFLFYNQKTPKQVYLNAEVLNTQLSDLIKNDINLNNNINFLFNELNTLYENKPKDILETSLKEYYDTSYRNDYDFEKIWLDFGTIKKWIGDEE